MRNSGLPTGMGVIQWKKFVVERIPLPKIQSAEQESIVQLVDRALATKDADLDADVSDLEAQIDRLVYELYGLNEAEVAAVEGR